jgi:hypothetical protein
MAKVTYEEHTSELGNKSIKRIDADGTIWWIPTDPANSDYQEYLKSLDETNTL